MSTTERSASTGPAMEQGIPPLLLGPRTPNPSPPLLSQAGITPPLRIPFPVR